MKQRAQYCARCYIIYYITHNFFLTISDQNTHMNYVKTTDHDAIREWLIQNNAMPIKLNGGNTEDDTISLAFEAVPADYEKISLEEFFDWMERDGLALRYRDGRLPPAERLDSFSFENANPVSSEEESSIDLIEKNEVAEENMEPIEFQ